MSTLKSSDIRMGMAKRWCAPEWAIMWEVADATGAASRRYADAVMMSLWPSRGLELHGVEIKISRNDWKREAACPEKAEAIAKYCDRWWIHTAPGVVDDLSDLPPAWGLREFDGKRWKTIREAAKTASLAPSRGFLAAMLRRADEIVRRDMHEAAKAMVETERAAIRKQIDDAVTRSTSEHRKLEDAVKAFETASGIKITRWGDVPHMEEIGRLAKAISEAGFASKYYGVKQSLETIRRAVERLETGIADIAPSDAEAA